MLMTPQQRGFADAYGETNTWDFGSLNIRFFQIYHFQKNITNSNG